MIKTYDVKMTGVYPERYVLDQGGGSETERRESYMADTVNLSMKNL